MDKPVRRQFRSRSDIVRLQPDVQARHGRVTSVAFAAFGTSERAVAFRNCFDDALGGRPLDVAGESEAAFQKVADAIQLRAFADTEDAAAISG